MKARPKHDAIENKVCLYICECDEGSSKTVLGKQELLESWDLLHSVQKPKIICQEKMTFCADFAVI